MTLRLHKLLRHQIGALLAGGVDFGSMILAVEVFGINAAPATAIGAALGAVFNFSFERAFVFASTRTLHGQALRYACISFASLCLNTGGEHVLVNILHVQYVIARSLVAFVVSVLWNFPMQRGFVFRDVSSP